MKKIQLVICLLFLCSLFIKAQDDSLIYPKNFKKREEWLLDSIELRNVFEIFVKPNQLIIVAGDTVEMEKLHGMAKGFILNPSKSVALSESPEKAMIAIVAEKNTSYSFYISVYKELESVYQEIWNEVSKAQFNKPYNLLLEGEKARILTLIPWKVIEEELRK
jgi:hypothetical protein